MKIDDPLDAASVHYINGVWGIIACAIFDSQRGFVSGSDQMGHYLGIQIAGAVSISLWSFAWTGLFFLPCVFFGVHKYHPVIEMLGAGRFKMGEITSKFISEVRAFGAKHDLESSGKTERVGNKPQAEKDYTKKEESVQI